jgi:hypothetical protein
MAGALEKKRMLIKYSNASKLGYKAKRIEANKYGLYPVLYGSYATYAEADKAKKKFRKRTIQKPGF